MSYDSYNVCSGNVLRVNQISSNGKFVKVVCRFNRFILYFSPQEKTDWSSAIVSNHISSCTRSGFSIAKMRRCSIISRSLSRQPCSKEKETWSGPLGSRILKPKIAGFLGESGLCFWFFVIALNISNREKREIIQLLA